MKVQASPILDAYGRQIARPIPPAWFADVVETWAREWGRHASTQWERNCFVTRFSRKADDPVMRGVQEGRWQEEGEPFYWHEFKRDAQRHPFDPSKRVGGYVALDIEQMGVEGVKRRLDLANLWSGRGEHASLDALADSVVAANERRDRANDAYVEGAARERANRMYRTVTGNPQVPVVADLKS